MMSRGDPHDVSRGILMMSRGGHKTQAPVPAPAPSALAGTKRRRQIPEDHDGSPATIARVAGEKWRSEGRGGEWLRGGPDVGLAGDFVL